MKIARSRGYALRASPRAVTWCPFRAQTGECNEPSVISIGESAAIAAGEDKKRIGLNNYNHSNFKTKKKSLSMGGD